MDGVGTNGIIGAGTDGTTGVGTQVFMTRFGVLLSLVVDFMVDFMAV
jgi:hypothetical protein